MRSLIIEDEPLARSRLKRLLVLYPEVEVIGEVEDGRSGLKVIAEQRPDLIFLDIDIPKLNGLEMLDALPEVDWLPLVVFVTSYNQYALKAFQANALGYLLKPIEECRLALAMHRARKLLHDSEDRNAEGKRIRHMVRHASRRVDQIVGKHHNHFVLLRVSEISYFEAETGLVKARTLAGNFEVDMTLDQLEKLLAVHRFFRAHRSTLVNLSQVREILPSLRSTYSLVFVDKAQPTIQVSERQAKVLRGIIPGL